MANDFNNAFGAIMTLMKDMDQEDKDKAIYSNRQIAVPSAPLEELTGPKVTFTGPTPPPMEYGSDGNLIPKAQEVFEENFDPTKATPVSGGVAPKAFNSYGDLKELPALYTIPPVSGDLSGEGNSSGVPTEFSNVPVPKSENFVPELYQPLMNSSVSEVAGGLIPQFIKDIPEIPFIRDNIIDPVSNVYEGFVADESKIPVAEQEIVNITALRDNGDITPERAESLIRIETMKIAGIKQSVLKLKLDKEAEKKDKVARLRASGLDDQADALEIKLGIKETPEVPADPTAAGLVLEVPVDPTEADPTKADPTKADPNLADPNLADPTKADPTVPTAVATKVDKNLKDSDIGGAGNETPKASLDEAKEDPTFFGKLWDSVKDIAKQGFEDPALRKALFAYTASKVLGGDGVSFGAAVLENEWKVQAAKAKADSDQAIASGKVKATASAKQAADLSPNFDNGVTLFDNSTRQEVDGVKSQDNSRFFPSNIKPFLSSFPDLKAGGSVPMSALIGSNAFSFNGETQDGAIQRLVKEAQTTSENAVKRITGVLEADPDMKVEKRRFLIEQLNSSTARSSLVQAVSSFVNGFPANTDFATDESVVQSMITKGMEDWIDTVARGGAKNNKDIASFFDFQKLKYDITDKGIPSSFFEVIGKPKGEIGQNAWAKVRTNAKTFNSVLNSKLKDSKLPQSDFTNGNVYKHLHRAYSNAMLTGPKGIKEHWESRSEASSDNKAEQLSPALLWVNSMFTKSKSEPQYLAGSPSDVANSVVQSIQNAKALLTKK